MLLRRLRPDERRIETSEAQTPLVVEPARAQDGNIASARSYLGSHSAELLRDLARHGAVLLRGFRVDSARALEDVVLSIDGLHGMAAMFMSEPGRTRLPQTQFALHTNSLYKTGGGLMLGGFHNENYYCPDVPRYISFACVVPSWLGGETGLVNTAALYGDLSETLRQKLERRPFWASAWRVSDIAARYGLTPGEVEEFCAEAGFPRRAHNGKQLVMMYKPSVVEHPLTGERGLQLNLWGELEELGFAAAVRKAFRQDYAGLAWAFHRLVWRFPRLEVLDLLGSLHAPKFVLRTLRNRSRRERPRPLDDRVSTAFSADEIDRVARAVRRRFSSFTWKRGDLLIIDNLKMAHAGMPGYGPRELAALLCNPLRFPSAADGPGCYAPHEESAETLATQLLRKAPLQGGR